MTIRRTLLAAALTAAALAPAPAASATCHTCFLAVPCGTACDVLYDVLGGVESRDAVDVHTVEHTICQLIVDTTHIERSCDEGHGRTGS